MQIDVDTVGGLGYGGRDMPKPPLSKNEIVEGLVRARYDIVSRTSQPDLYRRTIDGAIEALQECPRTAQELASALFEQAPTIAAAGWRGAADLMRDAARRIDWSLRHGKDLPPVRYPLSDADLCRDVERLYDEAQNRGNVLDADTLNQVLRKLKSAATSEPEASNA